MGPDRETARFVRHRDRVGYVESLPRNEARSPCTKVAIECLTKIADRSGADESACDVRAAHRRVARFFHYHIERDVETERPQLLNDARCADLPAGAKSLESRFEEPKSRNMQREHVDLALPVVRAQLDARNYTHTKRLACYRRERNTGEGVVIGERERAQACTVRRSHHGIGRENSV
jgi:hypothetical protein